MCFSATASIVTGSVLLATGSHTITKASKSSYLMLASVPIIFSIQQFAESLIWICHNGASITSCSQIPVLIFVIIGQSFWPIWIPLSVLSLEKNADRRRVLKGFTFIGVMVSTYYLFHTIRYGVEAKVLDHHIDYNFNYPLSFVSEVRWVYVLPTVLANFSSSLKEIKIFGILILLALVATQILFIQTAFSVWCFFAAIISIYIYFIIKPL